MILSSAAVIWLVLRLIPPLIALWLAGVFLLAGVVLIFFVRHLLMGHYRMHKRDWTRAIERYQRFEKAVLTHRVTVIASALFIGIYTVDAIALTRNRIAQAMVRQGKLDDAEGWLRSALQRDPLYCIPYTQLGTIAALRGQERIARREFQRAVDLGFWPEHAQQLLSRALLQGRQRTD